jgi:excisionase family DNA binding protein
MAQVVAKFPPRSVDNYSFGIPDFEPLLNSHQAAQLLDIHHKTLQKLARRGEIHGSHVGKMWRFRASDLNDWLDRQQRAS